MHASFNRVGEPVDPVEAPAPVQRAKNLVEEFLGLPVRDAHFLPEAAMSGTHSPGGDSYHCLLVSPTGKQIGEFTLYHRPSDGWVSIGCHEGLSRWRTPLQVAIDNFVNSPEGGPRALGEWKPDAAKLMAGR